jgi:helicase MOV-10
VYPAHDLQSFLTNISTLSKVAVTRAKALLIIVGNPHVLGLDPLWKAFLTYIHKNGGWTGSPDIPWDPQEVDDGPGGEGYGARVRREAEAEIDELARRVMEVSMDASGEEDVNVDRPWRESE